MQHENGLQRDSYLVNFCIPSAEYDKILLVLLFSSRMEQFECADWKISVCSMQAIKDMHTEVECSREKTRIEASILEETQLFRILHSKYQSWTYMCT